MKKSRLQELANINENAGWDYDLMEQIVDDVEQLDMELGKYDDNHISSAIDNIIDQLDELKKKLK